MNDSIQPLQAMHDRFCLLAGIDNNDLRFHREWSRYFWDFQQRGFNIEEMELVIRYVQKQNKKLEFKRKILPSKILGDSFCDDLVEAKRLAALRVSPRQQAVNEFRNFKASDAVRGSAVSLRDVLRKAVDAPDVRL